MNHLNQLNSNFAIITHFYPVKDTVNFKVPLKIEIRLFHTDYPSEEVSRLTINVYNFEPSIKR